MRQGVKFALRTLETGKKGCRHQHHILGKATNEAHFKDGLKVLLLRAMGVSRGCEEVFSVNMGTAI